MHQDQPTAPSPSPDPHEGVHGFDFFEGRWHVENRRLRKRLVGSDDWEIFHATQECRLLMDGLANVDEMRTEEGEPVGVSVRTFDPAKGTWSIYWIGKSGRLEPPVHGRFEQGIGTFLGKEVLEGQPIEVEYRWSGITPTSARWEQAFSNDGGQTWETNWVMLFTRIGAALSSPVLP